MSDSPKPKDKWDLQPVQNSTANVTLPNKNQRKKDRRRFSVQMLSFFWWVGLDLLALPPFPSSFSYFFPFSRIEYLPCFPNPPSFSRLNNCLLSCPRWLLQRGNKKKFIPLSPFPPPSLKGFRSYIFLDKELLLYTYTFLPPSLSFFLRNNKFLSPHFPNISKTRKGSFPFACSPPPRPFLPSFAHTYKAHRKGIGCSYTVAEVEGDDENEEELGRGEGRQEDQTGTGFTELCLCPWSLSIRCSLGIVSFFAIKAWLKPLPPGPTPQKEEGRNGSLLFLSPVPLPFLLPPLRTTT